MITGLRTGFVFGPFRYGSRRGWIIAVSVLTLSVPLHAQSPVLLADRYIIVDESHIAQERLDDRFRFPVFTPDFDFEALQAPSSFGGGPVGDKIARWYAAGTAAGNVGDLYENRDRGHSRLNTRQFNQFALIDYPQSLKDHDIHFGVKYRYAFSRPAIINSSMALTRSVTRRSLARLILHDSSLAVRLYALYRMSDFCFYPEHKDHDPGQGDVFAVNTPYIFISQGSSGSDKPFMNAVAQTLASFQPEVKEKLMQTGMLAPTVQMIMRWCYEGIGNRAAYLSGAAHPVAFEGQKLRPDAMVEMAHAISLEYLPPLAMIEVAEEKSPRLGIDYFLPAFSEALLTTPCAIARIGRSLKYEREYTLSARQSVDLNDRPLSFEWKVLRGDPSRIKLEKLNKRGDKVRVRISYQPATYPNGAAGLRASRVDIGAFVFNGHYYSAPAFFSIWYPPNEERLYGEDGRLLRVDYRDPLKFGIRADPVLVPDQPWSDVYFYDKDGELLGWERESRNDGVRHRFNAQGQMIPRDADWQSNEKSGVIYEFSASENGLNTVSWR